MIKIIVAYSRENRVIGKSGSIPWHIPEDLKHFKETTKDSCLIMGRNTWNSLPAQYRPLPGRINIILSRTPFESKRESYYVCSNLEFAIDLAKTAFPERCIYIVGGEQVFAESLEKDLVDEIIATEIHKTYAGDVYFPRLINDWGKEVMCSTDEFDIISYKIKRKMVANYEKNPQTKVLTHNKMEQVDRKISNS